MRCKSRHSPHSPRTPGLKNAGQLLPVSGGCAGIRVFSWVSWPEVVVSPERGEVTSAGRGRAKKRDRLKQSRRCEVALHPAGPCLDNAGIRKPSALSGYRRSSSAVPVPERHPCSWPNLLPRPPHCRGRSFGRRFQSSVRCEQPVLSPSFTIRALPPR